MSYSKGFIDERINGNKYDEKGSVRDEREKDGLE
jgi:hypothetical protein